MIVETKKPSPGFEMPIYGLGTSRMSREDRQGNNDVQAIRTAIDHGVAHIDTAEAYGDAEILVGEAIARYDRSQLFIVSKVQESNLHYAKIIEACKKSLQRLKTDYLDLYFAHRYPPKAPLAEVIAALDELKNQGLIRHIGISNFTLQHTKDAVSLTKHKIVATQVHYNLIFREAEVTGLLDYCQHNDMALIAWRPLEKGLFAKSIAALLNGLCEKYKKTASQIAINWLVSQKNVVTLSKTSSQAHLEENLGALGWQLDALDIELLRKEFPGQQQVSNRVPLA